MKAERMARDFFCGSGEKKKIHAINWNDVTKRKSEGGVGI